MMLMRWTPRDTGTNLVDWMGREREWMDRFFEEVPRPLVRSLGFGAGEEALPSLDVREYATEYVMTADVPGLTREELEIDVGPDRVILRGHHEEEREEQEGDFVCCERGGRRFERTVGIPGEIRTDAVTASLKDGVLRLHLPKAEVATTRRIEVTEH